MTMDGTAAKVLAERWSVEGPVVVDAITADELLAIARGRHVDQDPELTTDDVARLRLASCAPELARMLLEKEMGRDGACLTCRFGDLDSLIYAHEPDCEWRALMRKAGLL